MKYYDKTGPAVSASLKKQILIAVVVLLSLLLINAISPTGMVFILVNLIGLFIFAFITMAILKDKKV